MSSKNVKFLKLKPKKSNNNNLSKAKPPKPPKVPVAKSRALIISLNYPYFKCKLTGCWSDADLFQQYVLSIDPSCNLVRMKDTSSNDTFWTQNPKITYNTHFPTSANVLARLDEFVAGKEKVLYFYFAGHGGLVSDLNGDENNVIDSNGSFVPIVPESQNVIAIENQKKQDNIYYTNLYDLGVDSNFIIDDYIYTRLQKLKKDQTCYLFTDICHSGTATDVPFVSLADFKNSWPTISNVNLTPTDISNILTTYSTNAQFTMQYEMNKVFANRPPVAKIIHFGSTRSDTFSYEGNVTDESGNSIKHGYYTWANNRLLKYGAGKLTLRQYFTCLTALINDFDQIPMLSTSQKNVLDISGYLVTLGDPSKANKKSISPQEILNNKKINTSIKLSKSRGFK